MYIYRENNYRNTGTGPSKTNNVKIIEYESVVGLQCYTYGFPKTLPIGFFFFLRHTASPFRVFRGNSYKLFPLRQWPRPTEIARS